MSKSIGREIVLRKDLSYPNGVKLKKGAVYSIVNVRCQVDKLDMDFYTAYTIYHKGVTYEVVADDFKFKAESFSDKWNRFYGKWLDVSY